MIRREFIRQAGLASAGVSMATPMLSSCTSKPKAQPTLSKEAEKFFTVSLAEWSLHRALYAGRMTNLRFPERAKREFGINAVEYVNSFFKDKVADKVYLNELKQRCDDLGVTNVLVMIDDEGELGHKEEGGRKSAVENHKRWMEAAGTLGCKWIRVNATTPVDKFGGSREEVASSMVRSLTELATFGKDFGVGVIVENHGGYSSDGKWLAGVMKGVNMPECGTLPDFNNFCLRREKPDWSAPCAEWYDRYAGVAELLPFARDVSAKSVDFDENGNCTETDFPRMLKIVQDSGYRGYIGIEYEGEKVSEEKGIELTRALLLSNGGQL
jgi:sugar phosphate isomerase/epimerase